MKKNFNFSLKTFGSIFAGIGIVILVVMLLVVRDGINFRKTAMPATAVISHIEAYSSRDSDGESTTKHDVYVAYTVEGKKYENIRLGSYNAGMHEGKEIDILYNPAHPEKIRTKGSDIFGAVILGVIGLSFFIAGISIFMVHRRSRKKQERLMRTGTVVTANITDVCYGNVTVNNQPSHRIVCQWIDPSDGNVCVFKSKNIMFDPRFFLETNNIKTLPVYVDLLNPKDYYVDVSSVETKLKNA